jgi:hypothetical protein
MSEQTLVVTISRDCSSVQDFGSTDGMYFKGKTKQTLENRNNCSDEGIYQTA